MNDGSCYIGGSGYYYIDGRYYDPNEGIYIDAEPIENMFGNAETVFGLNRHTPTYDNILTMAAYAYAIFTIAVLCPDPLISWFCLSVISVI